MTCRRRWSNLKAGLKCQECPCEVSARTWRENEKEHFSRHRHRRGARNRNLVAARGNEAARLAFSRINDANAGYLMGDYYPLKRLRGSLTGSTGWFREDGAGRGIRGDKSRAGHVAYSTHSRRSAPAAGTTLHAPMRSLRPAEENDAPSGVGDPSYYDYV